MRSQRARFSQPPIAVIICGAMVCLEPAHKRREPKMPRNKLNLLRRPTRFRKEPFQDCWVESQALLSLSSRALSQPLHHARHQLRGWVLD